VRVVRYQNADGRVRRAREGDMSARFTSESGIWDGGSIELTMLCIGSDGNCASSAPTSPVMQTVPSLVMYTRLTGTVAVAVVSIHQVWHDGERIHSSGLTQIGTRLLVAAL
jgi:hypothetical protein